MLVQDRLALLADVIRADMHQMRCSKSNPTKGLQYCSFHLREYFVVLYPHQFKKRRESNIFRYSASSENVIFIHCFAPLLHLKHLFNDLYVSPCPIFCRYSTTGLKQKAPKNKLQKSQLGLHIVAFHFVFLRHGFFSVYSAQRFRRASINKCLSEFSPPR